MKNYSAYNIQIDMSVKETLYSNLLDTKSFLSRTIPWRVTFEVLCISPRGRPLNLEIALSAYFENRRPKNAKKTSSTKPRTKRG